MKYKFAPEVMEAARNRVQQIREEREFAREAAKAHYNRKFLDTVNKIENDRYEQKDMHAEAKRLEQERINRLAEVRAADRERKAAIHAQRALELQQRLAINRDTRLNRTHTQSSSMPRTRYSDMVQPRSYSALPHPDTMPANEHTLEDIRDVTIISREGYRSPTISSTFKKKSMFGMVLDNSATCMVRTYNSYVELALRKTEAPEAISILM